MRIALAIVVGLFVVSGIVLAQEVAAPVAAVESAVTEAAAATESALEKVATAVEGAQEMTLKGRVSVVKDVDGSVKAIYINPEIGHGYKVDLQNGEGKTLADKQGKTVEVTGMDVNMLFQVKTVTVLD